MNHREKDPGDTDLPGSCRGFNALDACCSLQNRYIALRHGESEANLERIIASDPSMGGFSAKLTAAGRAEVFRSARDLANLVRAPMVISSDFARAEESARILCETVGVGEIVYRKELRERFFGQLEGRPDSEYASVWLLDAGNPFHREYGVESAGEVFERTSRLILELESLNRNRTIILVSHGDPLQILQCAFQKVSPGLHRSVPHLKTAAYRELSLAV